VGEYYPPGAFYFTVHLLGTTTVPTFSAMPSIDSRFQEVSGIQSEWEFEPVSEGGENRFQHQLPTRAKYANLVLKRGAVTGGSPLVLWATNTIGSSLAIPIVPQNLMVMLLNEDSLPLIAWVFVNAYPVKWEISTLDSMKNELLIETLELAYSYFWQVNLGDVAGMASAAG